jgi:heme exporter protein D
MLLRCLGALAVCAMLSAGLTFLLWPLWSWVEAFSGFESMAAQSAPAWWCFGLGTAALFLGWLGGQRRQRQQRQQQQQRQQRQQEQQQQRPQGPRQG